VEWVTLEVFDSDAAAWSWRDQHADLLVEVVIGLGAVYWQWHEHRYGVAFEVLLPDDDAVAAFRTSAAVTAAVERAPDPAEGVLIYRGRGGGAGSGVPRRPRPAPRSGAVALPLPDESVGLVGACADATGPTRSADLACPGPLVV
jgi:hypothetical protein